MLKRTPFQHLRAWLRPPCSPAQSTAQANSDKGSRPENQDNYLLITPDGTAQCLLEQSVHTWQQPNWSKQWWRLAVADGVGGHQNGREIAQQLVQMLSEIPPNFDCACMRASVLGLHTRLLKQFAINDAHSPGSTLLWVDIHQSGRCMVAHIGDCRLYHWQTDHWQVLTHDHTSEEFDWRETPDFELSDKQNRVAQALGYGSFGLITTPGTTHRPLRFSEQVRLDLAKDLPTHAQSHADVFSFYLEPSSGLLLASDGLWSMPDTLRPIWLAPADLRQANQLSKLIWDSLSANQDDDTGDNATALLFAAQP